MLKHIEPDSSGLLYRDLRLKRLLVDESNGLLTLFTENDDGGELMIAYEEMYCSQFSEEAENLLIISVLEITLDELFEPQHSSCAQQLIAECGCDRNFLAHMLEHGNKLFLHITENGEQIVLAKNMWISYKNKGEI